MKHAWSCAYIEKKYKGGRQIHEWRMVQLHRFESQTDVKWTVYRAYGKWVFAPTWQGIMPSKPSADIRVILLDACQLRHKMDYRSFFKLIELFPHILSRDLIAFCKYLAQQGDLIGTVGRTGGCIAVRTK